MEQCVNLTKEFTEEMEKEFLIKIKTQSNHIYLVPRSARFRKRIRQIEIIPSKNSKGFLSIKIIQDERNYNLLEFSGEEQNKPLNSKIFDHSVFR